MGANAPLRSGVRPGPAGTAGLPEVPTGQGTATAPDRISASMRSLL